MWMPRLCVARWKWNHGLAAETAARLSMIVLFGTFPFGELFLQQRAASPLSRGRADSIFVLRYHAPGLAPAFQRRPQPAVEAEAVDRRRARNRADAQEARAGPLE